MFKEEKIYANALNQCLQIGPVSLRKIKEYYGSFQEGYKSSIEELQNITAVKKLIEFRKQLDPEKEFEILKKNKIKVLLKDELPSLLKEIPTPPEILYVKGKLPRLENTNLSVVGTRKHSSYGKEACERLVSELNNYDITIISGLAAGIDTIAHQTALKNKTQTVAILGSGLKEDVIYPSFNKKLAQEIVNQEGCLISEYPFTMKAAYFTFPQRNRIVAGMSQGVFVVEAPERSGALITAFLALEYNREVFALPGSIFSTNSKGANKLIKLGASPVTASNDILRALGIEPKTQTEQISLSPIEEIIISRLYEPLERDELIRKINLPIKEINSALTQMEIKGIIKEIGGLLYKL